MFIWGLLKQISLRKWNEQIFLFKEKLFKKLFLEKFLKLFFFKLKKKVKNFFNWIYKKKSQPQIKQDYPLNLSILLSGGRENNSDSLSSGERRGKSPNLKSLMSNISEL